MGNTGKPLRRRDLVWREVDGETVVLTSDNRKLQVFNDVGSRIWSLLDGKHDVSSIAAIISHEYDEQKDIVENDTIEYLEDLKRLDLVEEEE